MIGIAFAPRLVVNTLKKIHELRRVSMRLQIKYFFISLPIMLAIHFPALSQSQPAAGSTEADDYNDQGIELLHAGKAVDAIPFFDQAIRLKPQYAQAYINRAIAYHLMRQFNRALADYNLAIQISPKLPEAYYNRGITFNEIGQMSRAVDDFTRAIDLNSKYAEAFTNRGYANHRLGQFKRALEDYSQALKLDDKYAKAYYNRGSLYSDAAQYDLAIADFDKALQLDSASGEAYNNRGVAYFHLGRYDNALKDFSQALKLDPPYKHSGYSRGYVYLLMNRGDEAATEVRNYLASDGWREYYSQYAVLLGYFGYRQSKRDKEARGLLDEAVSKCDAARWPYPVIGYLSGDIKESDLLAAAQDNPKMNDARIYLALDNFFSNKPTEAQKQLALIQDKKRHISFEFHLAQTLLRNLAGQ
jgi:tetratricopeptide (TPR) repeat protein